MNNSHTPIYDFDNLKPILMTLIIEYDVDNLNLPALYVLIPATKLKIHNNSFIKKQGKIQFPRELNIPGEILSMRYMNNTKGIIRSKKPTCFPNAIIFDIGSTDRIISAELSKTIELRSVRTYEVAYEVFGYLVYYMKKCNNNIKLIIDNKSRAKEIADNIYNINVNKLNKTDKKIYKFMLMQINQYNSYEQKRLILNLILSLNRELFTGSLKMLKISSHMVNINFSLGYAINKVEFAKIMNEFPFICKFTNASNQSSIKVKFPYYKYDKNKKQNKIAYHTLRVNKSGHVCYSGPDLETMKLVYYSFMKRVIMNEEKIASKEHHKQIIKLQGKYEVISLDEFKQFIREQNELKEKLINGKIDVIENYIMQDNLSVNLICSQI
ncbi:MAG: hypothetical protein QW478_00820 [Candidatus Micrarchaeaceae archaeon]